MIEKIKLKTGITIKVDKCGCVAIVKGEDGYYHIMINQFIPIENVEKIYLKPDNFPNIQEIEIPLCEVQNEKY